MAWDSEEVALPDVGEAIPAGGLADPLLERELGADRVRLVGRRLAEHPAHHATRADLLRRLGRTEEAARAYARAADRRTREPPHMHVRSGQGSARFWLEPVSLHEVREYTPREVERIRRIVIANREILSRRWHDFFDQLPG